MNNNILSRPNKCFIQHVCDRITVWQVLIIILQLTQLISTKLTD